MFDFIAKAMFPRRRGAMDMIVMMVVVAVIGIFAFGLTGCKMGDIASNAGLLTTIELGGYNAGYYVGKSKTDADDTAIANAYKLAREGKLSPEEIAKSLAQLKLENPQLSGSLMIVLKNMGAGFGADGGLVDVTGIPVDYWDAAAAGYVVGYEMGKAGQKAARVSAVKKYLPKT